ncbi:GGDEF domain-containing protein [Actinoplanes sp. NPDC051411]|uniref:GGDEF domain-containing protein n=1 Tax=Actinoplanes sp. NPDC051411 TaxID=3155522 RepID=UPI003448CF44
MTTIDAPVDRTALAELIAELESRSVSQFRTLHEPAVMAELRAVELGDAELEHRAMLLQCGVLLREGRSAEGGYRARRVLDWAVVNDSPNLLARAHREMAVFHRQIGDLADALRHAVQCVANLADDAPPVLRAQHLISLAVALDENGSAEEAHRRFGEALDLATAVGEFELALFTLNNVAYIAYENDDDAGARALVARMRDTLAHCGRPFTANELDTVARVEMMSRRYAVVEELLGPVLHEKSAVRGDQGDALAECLLTLAEARRLDGRYADSEAALDAAFQMCEERGLESLRMRAHEERAAFFADTGRFREAYEEYRTFHAVFASLRSIQREARAHALHTVFEATEARKDNERFREMAYRDALTGLHNRRYLNEKLPAILGSARLERRPVSLAIIDLDHFKRINDTLSHSTGDAVLKQVSALLAEAATDDASITVRLGGEEFLLILPGVDAGEAHQRCERLRRRLQAYAWRPLTGDLTVTASIGVTTSPRGDDTMPDLLARADECLYAAKRGGRNQVMASG